LRRHEPIPHHPKNLVLQQARARAAGLRQAILKKAFAGELAPQEAEAGPAGELQAAL